MADPVTWSIIAATAAAGSAVIGTVGAIQQGKAQSSAASYQAQVAKNNAVVAEQNAKYAEQAGAAAAQNKARAGRAQLAKVTAAQAASGIDINTGSAVDVRAGDAETNKLDELTTMHNAQLQAYGYRTQAVNDTAQSGLLESESKSALTGGILKGAAGLLGSASSISGKFADAQNPGDFSKVSADDWYNGKF